MTDCLYLTVRPTSLYFTYKYPHSIYKNLISDVKTKIRWVYFTVIAISLHDSTL